MKLLTIVILIVLPLVFGTYYFKQSIDASKFKENCIRLTGKELTLQNIQTLDGKISIVERMPDGSIRGHREEITQQSLVYGVRDNTLYIYRDNTYNYDSCIVEIQGSKKILSATPNMHSVISLMD